MWCHTKLAEIVELRKEFITIDDLTIYRRPRVQLHGQGIVLRDEVAGLVIKTKQQQVCRAGEFLVAEIDAKVGGFGVVPTALDGAIVSSHYFLFHIDASRLDQRFLDYFVKTPEFKDQVTAQGSTNYAAIRPGHVLGYSIPLPPLDEQRRIVTRIEVLLAQIEEARRLRDEAVAETGALNASHAYALFARGEIGNWPIVSLGGVAEIRSGVTLGRRLNGQTVHLPYLRVANVQDGHLDVSKIKHVQILETEIDKWKLERGDILLTEGGDWDKLGRGTVWQDEIPGCIHQNHIFRVRVQNDKFIPEFVAALIGSPIGKDYFKMASKQTTNLASINQRQLKAFPLPQPPIAEQYRILEELRVLTKATALLRKEQAETASALAAFIPALFDRAFKEEL
jgi:type I restriction enzyme S subunit